MKKQTRKQLWNRKRVSIRRVIVAFSVVLLINHIMHIGLFFPIQAIRQLEERAGISHTRVVDRSWMPEIHMTQIAYLTENDEATLFGYCRLTLYGWMTGLGTALDCTGEKPLYAGASYINRDDGRAWYFFGRADDPAIQRVEISLCEETYDNMSHAYVGNEVRRITEVELEEQSGRRYFLVKEGGEWDYETYSTPRPIVIGYDDMGNEVARVDIWQESYSSFG